MRSGIANHGGCGVEHSSGCWTRNPDRIEPAQGRYGAEDGTQHDLDGHDGPSRICKRKSHVEPESAQHQTTRSSCGSVAETGLDQDAAQKARSRGWDLRQDAEFSRKGAKSQGERYSFRDSLGAFAIELTRIMKALDLIIIFSYLIGIVLFGTWFSRKQKTTRDYFLGGRSVPWWAVAFSIVATETSTISFISVPGIAFARGGNFQFLQLVFGYLLGRIVISILFIPSYFRGELLTVYQLLDQRFGGKIKMLAASLFVVMRNIADGIRLLLTAIVLAAVYAAFQPATSPELIIIGSIILIGLAMIIFTYFGGMEAVIWVE